jgi:hypothetical protein
VAISPRPAIEFKITRDRAVAAACSAHDRGSALLNCLPRAGLACLYISAAGRVCVCECVCGGGLVGCLCGCGCARGYGGRRQPCAAAGGGCGTR